MASSKSQNLDPEQTLALVKINLVQVSDLTQIPPVATVIPVENRIYRINVSWMDGINAFFPASAHCIKCLGVSDARVYFFAILVAIL